MTTIEIKDFIELQKVMEEYDLSEFASIPQLLCSLFQATAHRDIANIIVNIHQSILPDYYAISPWHLKNQLKGQIQYDYISIHKKYRGDWVAIQVSTEPIQAIFKQRLIEAAQENTLIRIPRHEIPESYQQNPFVILSRIKKQHGIHIKLKARTPKEYLYVRIQP